jgi:hypothetical protein
MAGKKYIKATLLSLALVVGAGFAISRININDTVKASVSKTLLNAGSQVGAATDEETDLEESSSPVYFNIFRFISNLVPGGSSL